MIGPVRKAIIPAAGFGTRFLPITKSIPKEMLPILDKPVAQYVVEEAAASGITDILFVISKSKRPLEEYFQPLPELESELAARSKTSELNSITRLPSLARIHFVFQEKMLGLGDAVLHGEAFANGEPVAVMLGDTILHSSDPAGRPVTRQLIDAALEFGGSAVAVEEVPESKVSRYGIVGGAWKSDTVLQADRLIEKPSPAEAPSRLAISARYVLTSAIFPLLRRTPPGKNGEIQLTDAMAALLRDESLFGVKIAGQRFDVGNKIDFVKTNLQFALQDPDTRDAISEFVKSLRL